VTGTLMSVGLALAAGSCRDRSITGASPGSLRRTIDVETATLQVNVLYAGQPVREAGIGAGCYRIDVDGLAVAWFCGSSWVLEGLAPGDHTLALTTYNPSRGDYVDLSGPVAFSLAAGETATRDLELATRLALLTGRLTINGEPAPSLAYRVCTSVECDGEFGPDGTFSVLAQPGSGTATVTASGTPSVALSTFGYTASAGETTDAGTILTVVSGVDVSLRFAGQPLREAGIGSGCYRLDVDAAPAAWFCGSDWALQGLAPGNHTLSLWTYNPSRGDYTDLSGPVSVSLPAGETPSREIDLAGRLGLVTGRLTINGQPAPSLAYRVCTTLECDGEFGADGSFAVLAEPGSGTGRVAAWGNPSVTLAEFGFTAAAGQTTDVGVVEQGTATLGVSLSFAGQPVREAGIGSGCYRSTWTDSRSPGSAGAAGCWRGSPPGATPSCC
jgi:hypothetical protein